MNYRSSLLAGAISAALLAGCTPEDLNLSITPNQAPNAVNDRMDMWVNSSVLINVLANDSDPDDNALSLVSAQDAEFGQVFIEQSQVRYTPNKDYVGVDSFTYTISDGKAEAQATVIVTVKEEDGGNPNSAPVLNDPVDEPSRIVEMTAGEAVSYQLEATDTDGDTLTFSFSENFPSWLILDNATGKITGTPEEGEWGNLVVTVSDGKAETSSAPFTIVVKALPPEPEPESLVIWMGGDKAHDGLTEVGKRFEAATGITVKVEHPDDVTGKFTQAAATGSGPDIMIWAHDRFGEWVQSGLLAEVHPSDEFKSQFADFTWDGVTYGGATYGYPVAVESISLIYNKDLVPTPPKTWEEIPALDKKLQEEHGAHAILWDYNNTFFTWPLISADGGYVFGQNGTDYNLGDVGVNNAGAVNGVQVLKDLIDNGHVPAGADYPQMESQFVKGEVAMIINGAWGWSNYKDVNYGVTTIPSLNGNPAKPFVGVLSAGINAASSNGDLAQEFIENYMLTVDGLTDMNNDKTLGAVAHNEFQSIVARDPRIAATMASAEDGMLMPSVPEMGKFWAAMGPALENVTAGRQSVKDALDTAAKRILGNGDIEQPPHEPVDEVAVFYGVDPKRPGELIEYEFYFDSEVSGRVFMRTAQGGELAGRYTVTGEGILFLDFEPDEYDRTITIVSDSDEHVVLASGEEWFIDRGEARDKLLDTVELADVQTLVRGNGWMPESLDPALIDGTPDINVALDLFETLVLEDQYGRLVPGVAEAWESADSNFTWYFYLRDDARWSNGAPVTAHDFVYSWQRVVDPQTASPYSWFMDITAIENASAILYEGAAVETLGVEALDDWTLAVSLEQPLPYFAQMTAHATLAPVYKATVEAHGADWTQPQYMVSNGAYQLDEVESDRVVLVRNPEYWNDGQTVIDEVQHVASQETDLEGGEYASFQAGELHLTANVPSEKIEELKQSESEELKISTRLGTYYYAFNVNQTPFNEPLLRKALTLAVDRDVIVKHITKAGQTPAYNFTPAEIAGFNPERPEWADWTQAERDAKARELFAQAGYGPQNPLNFELLYNTSEGHKKIALAIASMWTNKLVDVEMTLHNQSWSDYLDTTNRGDFALARKGWVGDYNEASTMLDLGLSRHGNNDGGYMNLAFDDAMAQAKVSQDPAERSMLYQQAEAMLMEDLPYLPLYHYTDVRLVSSKVGGYSTQNPQDKHYSKNLYLLNH